MRKVVLITLVIVALALFVSGCGEKLNSSKDKVLHEGTLVDARYLQQSSWASSPTWQLSFADGFTIKVTDDEEIFGYEEGFVLGQTYRIYAGHIYDNSYVYAAPKDKIVSVNSW